MYKLNEVVYFVHGIQVVKGFVEESIEHKTQNGVIIKYIIRPYGLENFVTMEAENVYSNLDAAKQFVLEKITKEYTKENLIKAYKDAKAKMEAQHKSNMNAFNTTLKANLERINQLTDPWFDEKEAEYQKTLVKPEDNSVQV